MITLTMQPASDYRRANYGLLWESVQTVTVSGRARRNHGDHTLHIYEPYAGHGTHFLTPGATVISAYPTDRPARAGDVAQDDQLQLVFPDGHTEIYRVQGRTTQLSDPELLPVTDPECIGTRCPCVQ